MGQDILRPQTKLVKFFLEHYKLILLHICKATLQKQISGSAGI